MMLHDEVRHISFEPFGASAPLLQIHTEVKGGLFQNHYILHIGSSLGFHVDLGLVGCLASGVLWLA